MSLNINPAIFREYDIRGIAGKDVSGPFAERLGKAYGLYIQERIQPAAGRSRLMVSVGRDCRLSSDELADGLISGIRSVGIDVVSLGVCPTPLTYFSIFDRDLDGGIMVTGSHNPSDYNGFKICMGKDSLHGKQIQELKEYMLANKATDSSQGQLSQHEIIPDYIAWVVKHLPNLQKKKVVLDAGNGTASTVAPELFKQLGSEVIPLYCELDGTFPNHHPDPTVPENLNDLVAKVKETNADFGVGFDGDSDRIGLVDEKGQIVFGDVLMVLLSRAVLKENPGSTIISEVKSSHRLYQDIEKQGGKPIMWKTGHSLIKSKLKETKGALAGEMSGHIFFADRYFGYDDAIYTAARVLEIASQADGPISSLVADLDPVIATPEIRVDCEEEKKFQLVEESKKILSPKHKINDIDGIRVDFGDSWGLLRASNTQPVLVLRFEAPSQQRLDEVRGIFESALKEAASKLGHAPVV